MAAATRIVLGYSKLNAPGVWFQILINDGHGQFGNETDARDLGGPAIVESCSESPQSRSVSRSGDAAKRFRRGVDVTASGRRAPRNEKTPVSAGVSCHAPGMIRTCDLCLRRAALYPLSYGRGEGECSCVADREP